MENIAISKLIGFFGSRGKLIAAMEVTPGALSQWEKKGKIPPARAIWAETKTNGLIKATELI